MSATIRLVCAVAIAAGAIGSGITYVATRSTVTVTCPTPASHAGDNSWQRFTGSPPLPTNTGKGF